MNFGRLPSRRSRRRPWRRSSVGLWLASALMATAAPTRADVTYKTEIKLQGLDDSKLAEALEAASQLVTLEDKPPVDVNVPVAGS